MELKLLFDNEYKCNGTHCSQIVIDNNNSSILSPFNPSLTNIRRPTRQLDIIASQRRTHQSYHIPASQPASQRADRRFRSISRCPPSANGTESALC